MLITFPKLVAYTNWNFTVSLSDYPATTHALTINFFKDDANKFSLEAVADETVAELHRITKTSSESGFDHGTYSYQAIASADGEDIFVEEGRVTIFPNLAQSTDPRGEWTKRCEAAKTAFDLLLKSPTTQVSAEGVSYTYEERFKLLSLINTLEEKMKIETGQSKSGPKIYNARFS